MEDTDATGPARSPASRGHCPNCGTPLRGPYCHQCGQEARERIAPLGTVLKDLLNETFNFDTRVIRTLKPLLAGPGRLTKEYIAGRRADYVPPLRLFIFSSFVLFLMLGFIGTWVMGDGSPWMPATAEASASADTTRAVGVDLEAMSEPNQNNVTQLPPAARDSLKALADSLRQRGTLGAQFQYALINGTLQSTSDPERFVQSAVGRLSGLSFLMLPVFALLLKLLYIRAGRYYVEHLIMGLHTHAFLFILLIVVALLGLLGSSIASIAAGTLAAVAPPVYLLLAMRRVYEQGWMFTVLKWIALLFVYSMVLGIAFGVYLILTLALM